MTTTLRLRPTLWRSVSLAVLGLAVAACGSAVAKSSSSSPKATTRGNFNGAAGTVVQVSSSSLTLATVSGTDVSVTYTSATPVISTSTGSYQDIAVGTCMTATGTKDASGAIAVASVSISQPVNGSCNTRTILGGSPRAFPSGAARGTFRARPRASVPANFAAVRGQVTAVSGTTVTINDAQTGGTETVTVPTTVSVDITSPGNDSDLAQGVCVLAAGQKAASGTITARTLAIEPPGPSGCFTGTGRGGFPGLGGAGAGPIVIGGGK
jgi:hypothetical protein